MDSVTLENFRCFRESQTAQLAPLTLLVGENSTGKTSFLAMVRALSDITVNGRSVPDFKREPYDLGNFDDIAHFRGGKGGRAKEFMGGFTRLTEGNSTIEFMTTFRKRGIGLELSRLEIKEGEDRVLLRGKNQSTIEASFGTSNGMWQRMIEISTTFGEDEVMLPLRAFSGLGLLEEDWSSVSGSPEPTENDIHRARNLFLKSAGKRSRGCGPYPDYTRLYASAPVRSQPRRTYDAMQALQDPEGAYIPMLYAKLRFQRSTEWEDLKAGLESFGKDSGLFDEIIVKPVDKEGTVAFQLSVRKKGDKAKGPYRNLIDVGYGNSQILPVITELLLSRPDAAHLLQQPEVHLHPSAQAALGSFFCQIAGRGKQQLLVETHSDYLVDRVRMDVRDGECDLNPEDVSILFFERKDMEVKIHTLRIDEEGNITDAPDSYQNFFMAEVNRSLWKRSKK